MLVIRYNGLNYTLVDGKAVEVETELPLVQGPYQHRCDRCGLWATGGFQRVNAPICIGGTLVLCIRCVDAALQRNLLVKGRFRLTAICDEHIHVED